MDIEDFLGTKQAALFEKEIAEVMRQQQFPETSSIEAVKYWVATNPLEAAKLPAWKENHVTSFLQELYKLGKTYFGNANFARQVVEKLQDMPEGERSLFISWLNQSSLSKLWQ
jgi:hypothetical protein